MKTPVLALAAFALPLAALPGQGYPKFDAAKAKVYFRKVCDKVADLVKDTIRRWDAAGL